MEVFIILFILLTIITLIGHGIWVFLAWFLRTVSGNQKEAGIPSISTPPEPPRPAPKSESHACVNCGEPLTIQMKFCGVCGAHRPTLAQEEHLRELQITLRHLDRLRQAGEYKADFAELTRTFEAERDWILFPNGKPERRPEAAASRKAAKPEAKPQPVEPRKAATPPFITPAMFEDRPQVDSAPRAGAWSKDSEKPPPPPPPPPRKPFADVLAAFMEQSNIRWGEIIGGLLIIGCSTALVVSLWAQISRVPVIKFLIFTTVTAALFGIGFYTAHRWKLPTTSRGILTIATLLVPLNFLAIAAVSTNTTPGVVVLGSEIIAPVVFLCLVYFAGQTITSKWPHLLAAGALGSSVGQLLIRHFATADISPTRLIALAAFPVICYVGATGWMLKLALADGEIDESEATEVFTTLGALTFAAILPFGLLLFKSASVATALMHISPLVTLAGTPTFATGMLLWRRSAKELAATRTAGASIAIFGMGIALAGMILAWPNPASLIPAALFNFALFTAVAILLEEHRAHVLAAGCLTFAYLVAFHVAAGHVPWQNFRVVSLLQVTASARSGQALALPFVAFLLVHEWLRRKRDREALAYLIAAGSVAVVSIAFLIAYAIPLDGDPFRVSAILVLYAAGAFWFAWRRRRIGFTWAGAALLFGASLQVCNFLLQLHFPEQASFLFFALAGVVGAVLAQRLTKPETAELFVVPLETCAIFGSILAALLLVAQLVWFACEPAAVFTTRAFILAAVLLGLLSLTYRALFFSGFQVVLTLAIALLTRFILQHFDWYAFQPDAWLDPRALQVQGIVLGLMCLGYFALRAVLRRARPNSSERGRVTRIILESRFAFDHALALTLVFAFAMVLLYGSATGIGYELSNPVRAVRVAEFAGHPHQLIFGIGSLVLVIVLTTLMVGNLIERRSEAFALGTVVVLWTLCPLIAGRFESQVATASAGRWALAIFLLIASVLYAFRDRLWNRGGDAPGNFDDHFASSRAVLLLATLGPLLLLTFLPTVAAVNYVPARGPQSGIFQWMGGVALYGVPLVLAVAALAVHAVRERSAPFAFAAGLLVNFTATVVYLISVAGVNRPMDRVVLVTFVQLNAIAAASVALIWISTRTWWTVGTHASGVLHAGGMRTEERVLLIIQASLAIALNAALIVPLVLHLIAFPDAVGRGTFAASSFTGWLALLLTIAALFTFHKASAKAIYFVGLAALLLSIGALTAFRFSQTGAANRTALHGLLTALVMIAWLLLAARRLPSRHAIARTLASLGTPFADGWAADAELFAGGVGIFAVIVALRDPFNDPTGAWWSIGPLLAMTALATTLNWITFRRGYLYAAGVLFNLAVSIWLIEYSTEPGSLTSFIEANIVALSLAGILWLCLELRARRVAGRSSSPASFHNVVALASLAALALVIANRLYNDLGEFYQLSSPRLDLIVLVSVTALMIACLWDRDAGYAVAGMYFLGLLGIATATHHLHLTPRNLIWVMTIAVAVQAIVSAVLWRTREQLLGLAARLKIPPRISPITDRLRWLLVFNAVTVSLIVASVFWIDIAFDRASLRLLASLAVAAQLLTFGLMAEGRQRRDLQRTAIAVFLGGLVFVGWAFLTPGTTGTWLNRAVILMILMFMTIALFGAGLSKFIEREANWTQAFRDCVPVISLTGLVALGFILCTEIYYQIEFGAVRVTPWALAAVAVTLAAAIVVCIFFALSPKHDPLNLPERWRGCYVYAAEVLLVLLFMHIRLTMPWLFHGFFRRYWPLIVLLIAYAGIGISEFFRRRQIHVLAQPIERTGAFLPLLPVIGFWIAASQVEYSTLLFVVGGLYGLLAILRKSFWFGLAAALAGNGGLWYLLHETSDYQFYQHPQLWLIPAALSVLVAAHLNRKDFSESQMTGIRYLCLATIYVSSTADIFINGVATSPWLPLALAGLSVAGVFAGMIFRVRAFLLLGSVFLLLAIATMIKFASVNFGWTWLWYVAGIVTGAAIITTFAIFEKQRADVMRLVEEFKDWKG
jgi:hypothetical protein